VAALVGALIFGAGCWTEGCERLAFYRGDHDGREQANQELKDDGDRARVEALYAHWVDVADLERNRAIPFAAATFVLGAALLALAGRGLAGRSNARSAIIQVVAAQAIVVAASWWMLRDVRHAEWNWTVEQAIAKKKETTSPAEFEQAAPAARTLMHGFSPAWLVIRTACSALIVFALTRQRSRELFEAKAKGQEAER
jgi:hypothetical protein